ELFKSLSGTNLVHVPHRGSGDARTSVIGGHVHMMIDALSTTQPTVDAGQVRALATTGTTRSSVYPDLPTVAEAGVPGYEAVIWLGIMAPKGTSGAIIDTLNAHINGVLRAPEVRDAWAKQGVAPMIMSPAEFADYVRADIEKWAKVIAAAGIKLQH